jgi:hypothetical protein
MEHSCEAEQQNLGMPGLPPQGVVPAPQTHAPEAHVVPAVHIRPHAPQLFMLPCRSVQVLPLHRA